MRLSVIAAFIVLISACSSSDKWETKSTQSPEDEGVKTSYQKRVEHYRDSISAVFCSGMNKVLPPAAISTSCRLKYFDVNEKFKVQARFEPIKDGAIFKMKTNTERLPEYRNFGKLYFEIGGESLVLTLYQNVEQPDYLFCPFKDLTNGKESYGAGRYLDFRLKDIENPVLDFNYSYNPYCAYNDEYSCPIPPQENHLNIAVLAGEKNWH